MKSFGKAVVLGLLCAAVSGCASYYHVHDPSTGKDYYTHEIKQDRAGATTLKDARTGRQVTVQNSEVEQISEEQFNTGRYAQQPAAAPQTTTGQPPQPMDANKKPDSSGNPF